MKKIIAIILALLLCISFVGCSVTKVDNGKATADQSTTANETAAAATQNEKETSAADKGGKAYATIEDYINDPEVKASIDSAKEAAGDVLTFDYHAEDNKLIYDYSYNNHFDDESVEILKGTLEESLETNSEYYSSVVDVLVRNVNVENPQIVINYRNDDGTIIATRTYD